MYVPSHFVETRLDVLHTAMRAHPLAALVVMTPGGLTANHIPLLLSADGSTLTGHVARANPMWKSFDPAVEALAIFTGPQAYVSPNLYPSKRTDPRVVPTWNYIAVHAHGPLTTFEDRTRLLTLVTALTDEHESVHGERWHVRDAPADYIDKLLGAIVGIEIPVRSLTGKWKVSQNRSADDRASVVQSLGWG